VSEDRKRRECFSEQTFYRTRLWESLLALPDEINAQILCELSAADVFALRLTSRAVCDYLQYHAGPITRSLLLQSAYQHTTDFDGSSNRDKAHYLCDYIQKLYPAPQPQTSFNYLLQTLKRQSQIEKMLAVLTNWIQMKVYIFPRFRKVDNFSPFRHSLVRRLHVAAWTIYHFLEQYRTMLVLEHPSHRPAPAGAPPDAFDRCHWCVASTKKLLRIYPHKEVVPAYLFYDLIVQHLKVLSRAPSAGRLRAKRSTTSDDLIQLIVLGGIPELCTLSLLKGSANQRIHSITKFVDRVSSARILQNTQSNGPSQPSGLPQSTLFSGMETPFHLIRHGTVSALPRLDTFITGTEEWIVEMTSRVSPGDQVVGSWGLVTNVLMDKSKLFEDVERRNAKGEDPCQDFLAPVMDLNEIAND
jgi:hypothetical protein